MRYITLAILLLFCNVATFADDLTKNDPLAPDHNTAKDPHKGDKQKHYGIGDIDGSLDQGH